MKYIEKYANEITGKPLEIVGNAYLISDKEQGCMMCKEPTKIIEVCIIEAYICSEECMNVFWDVFNSSLPSEEDLISLTKNNNQIVESEYLKEHSEWESRFLQEYLLQQNVRKG